MSTFNLFISWYIDIFGVQSTIQNIYFHVKIACEIETCPYINDDHDLHVLEFND
jgi:hypothetical protein